MTTLLAVKGHPLDAKDSHAIQLLESFLTTYKETNPNDEIIVVNPYAADFPEIDGDITSGWHALMNGAQFNELTAAQQAKLAAFNGLTEQFEKADKVVIANPLWNLSIPSRLKAWFDTICVAGKTFKYTAEGPVGLVTGKKALHIQASGGFYNGQDFAAQYTRQLLNFIGISDFSEVLAEGLDFDPTKVDEIMAKATTEVKAAAKTF
ncbi:FMN-dependent NADH-azoreductase [Enterococcus sp. MJM12]|uniref:FMN dependent NADH:quinone oxidoreductase n=1 Tax=Candidatus Enterococcus myersii TaxID=2815322 RepID=A0ABS3H7J1_9ENTE|nr:MULTISPECIES: FMN-dependent NADH-azoreductase [Enterococcus]MBO0449425.1 FMN-dependent NADH-azoreductase [Enterococcus sp. MJM12]MCD1025570.1 FMN-dependent NADH-azoreductase [Enterococcus sp. SMC-9]MDT2738973.1 FMN-dependent NADH-azoreductase [Enterococcus canintestini]WHA09643.1 FMN-dependent NADH-azoreductase [Enterococcus montenegrensis]